MTPGIWLTIMWLVNLKIENLVNKSFYFGVRELFQGPAAGKAIPGTADPLVPNEQLHHQQLLTMRGLKQGKRAQFINPSLFSFQLATVQPGQNFHMFTKEELEEVIKDI